MFILKHFNIDLNGKHVVVIGRSNIVGRPISILASLKELGNATVTLCHSGTKDLKYFSDLLSLGGITIRPRIFRLTSFLQ